MVTLPLLNSCSFKNYHAMTLHFLLSVLFKIIICENWYSWLLTIDYLNSTNDMVPNNYPFSIASHHSTMMTMTDPNIVISPVINATDYLLNDTERSVSENICIQMICTITKLSVKITVLKNKNYQLNKEILELDVIGRSIKKQNGNVGLSKQGGT